MAVGVDVPYPLDAGGEGFVHGFGEAQVRSAAEGGKGAGEVGGVVFVGVFGVVVVAEAVGCCCAVLLLLLLLLSLWDVVGERGGGGRVRDAVLTDDGAAVR